MEVSSLLSVVLYLTLLTGLSSYTEAVRHKRSTLSDVEFELSLVKYSLKAERNARVQLEQTASDLKQRLLFLEGRLSGGDGPMRSLQGNPENPILNNIGILQKGLIAEKNRNVDLEISVSEIKDLLLQKFNASILTDWQAESKQYCRISDLHVIVAEVQDKLMQFESRLDSTDLNLRRLNFSVATLAMSPTSTPQYTTRQITTTEKEASWRKAVKKVSLFKDLFSAFKKD